MKERIAGIIVAAGQSTRFGAPKILTPIAGTPAIARVVRSFQSAPDLTTLVVVVHPGMRPAVETLLANEDPEHKVAIVSGGPRRQDSVAAGLAAVGNPDLVVIHDGARPLVTPQLITAVIVAVQTGADAAIAAIPVTDTLKRLTQSTVETIDRTDVWRAQTPQAFRTAVLRSALAEAERRKLTVTDESSLIERFGGSVTLVPGDEQNLKLTNPGDELLAEALAQSGVRSQPSLIRNGIGYDVHRLVSGRPLVLGGVEIPYSSGLDGHSDADVLLHAAADAILGACALGDIGHHFPPADEAYRGISSLTLLSRVATLATDHRFDVVHLDVTVIAEAPRISPYVSRMREVIAGTLNLPQTAVSIKATTSEGLGFAGRGEGIAAMAVATVRGWS